MASIKALYKRVKALHTDPIITRVMEDNKDELLEYNKEQLLEGKTNQGTDITPSYWNDPYFKSQEAAQRYSDWKDKITPNAKRNRGTPNLFINGRFHRSVTIKVTKNEILFRSGDPAADNINRKFKNIYGLGGDLKQQFVDMKLRPALIGELRSNLRL